MTLTPHPSPLTDTKLENLTEKFEANEISDEQRARQEKYRAKLDRNDCTLYTGE